NVNTNTVSYILDNQKADKLGAGDAPTETFTIPVVDGNQTGSTDVVFTIEGRNDAPRFGTSADLSFETGLSTWDVVGSAFQVVGGTDGSHAAQLDTGVVSAAAIETLLQIPLGSLAQLNAGAGSNNPTYGSAIATDIFLQAGQTITFDWRFKTDDYF